MFEPFNGHPSYEHHNVSMWFDNDEGLHSVMRFARNGRNLWETLNVLGYLKTPDGVEITKDLCFYLYAQD